jgi:hypothetical protein
MLRNELHQSFDPALESAYAVIVPSAKEMMAKRILTKLGKAPGAGRMPPEPRRKVLRGKRIRIDRRMVNRVREIIEEWPGTRIDWVDVVAAANREFKANWTRQSLAFHDKIQKAFREKKKDLAKAKPARRSGDITVEFLEHQVRKLTDENLQLRIKLATTEARMARWRQNAFLHRLTIEQLDEDMQENDRGRSDH